MGHPPLQCGLQLRREASRHEWPYRAGPRGRELSEAACESQSCMPARLKRVLKLTRRKAQRTVGRSVDFIDLIRERNEQEGQQQEKQ